MSPSEIYSRIEISEKWPRRKQMANAKEELSVVILTYNEELHLERCLNAVSSIADEIVIIDSYSTDRTLEIARAFGATIYQNPWTNHARQFQWGLDQADLTSSWIMRLDADEVIEPDLATEISVRLSLLPPEVTGIALKRKHVFMGRWIRHGGRYPLNLLRIWRRGAARVEQRWMDEHILLTSGKLTTFNGGFADVNLNDLSHFTDKHNKYATLEAVDVINSKLELFPRDEDITSSQTSKKTAVTRFIKEKFYNKIPFQLSALSYFVYRYIFQFGFLDGREGAIYHVLQGFWYRYLVGAKVYELECAIAGRSKPEALEELRRRTGLKI